MKQVDELRHYIDQVKELSDSEFENCFQFMWEQQITELLKHAKGQKNRNYPPAKVSSF